MDLALTDRETAATVEARAAFEEDRSPSPAGRTMTELVLMGIECGRAAAPVAFHASVLAALVGWPEPERAAVGLATPGETSVVVHGPRGASFFLILESKTGLRALDPAHVNLSARPTIDDPDACGVTFEAGRGEPIAADVDGAIVRAGLIRAADAVGAVEAALASTVAFLPKRTLYAAPLSDRQVVRHRVADMAIDAAIVREAVLDAAGVCDRREDESDVRLAIALARSTVGVRAVRATASAHQLAGGAGILADQPLHRWFSRARAAALELGDTRRQLEVIAGRLLAE